MPSNRENSARAIAFRAFVDSRHDPEAARIALGIAPRGWQRMRGSSAPPPAALLEQIADTIPDEPELAAQLRHAAGTARSADHA